MINLFETIKEHPEYFKQLSCKELLFTQYDCPQEEARQDLYAQNNYIVYVLSGNRIFLQPGATIAMTAGKCVFVKKGGWIAEKGPADGWCVLVFFIPDDYLKQFVREYRTSLPIAKEQYPAPKQMFELTINDTTTSFFTSMVPYFTQNPPPPADLLELKFRELVFNVLVNPFNKELLTYLCSIADRNKTPLAEIMEANFTYNLSLADFAKLAHRSLAAFKREFTTIFNTSPGKWLLGKRIEYAKLLLHTSGKSIIDIAFESGFENTSHFSRVFKEKTGVAPLHFRQQATT